jgi:hypothetical protein
MRKSLCITMYFSPSELTALALLHRKVGTRLPE